MLADQYCHGNFESCVFYFEQLTIVLSVMVNRERGIPQHISKWYKDEIQAYM